jgi:hypothetical protein
VSGSRWTVHGRDGTDFAALAAAPAAFDAPTAVEQARRRASIILMMLPTSQRPGPQRPDSLARFPLAQLPLLALKIRLALGR